MIPKKRRDRLGDGVRSLKVEQVADSVDPGLPNLGHVGAQEGRDLDPQRERFLSRKAGSTSERARVAVTRALRTAIRRVSEHHPALGEHLDQAVRTGTYCSYGTAPGATVRWSVGI